MAAADEELEEELEDVSPEEKQADQLMGKFIRRTIDGQEFTGRVQDIEVGKLSREKLYRIEYEDGDLEHLTQSQVIEMQVRANDQGGEDGEEADSDDDEVAKKPAAKAKAKGKAAAKTIAKKPAASSSAAPQGKAKAKAVMKKPAGR